MNERLLGALRATAIGTFAGGVVGALVGGLGGRLAMRVSGHLTEPGALAATANGNLVGEITLAGTVALVIFVGIPSGIVGGLVYALVRPSLAWTGAWRGLVFGVVMLAVAGPTILDPFNFDFTRFGPAWLNVAMFATLFLAFGLLIEPAYSLVDRWSTTRSRWAASLTGLAWLSLVPTLVILSGIAFQSLSALGAQARIGFMTRLEAATIFLAVAIVAAAALAIARERDGWTRPMYVAFVGLLVAGGLLTTRVIVEILA